MAARELLVGSIELRPDGILHAVIDFEDPPTEKYATEYVDARRELSGESVPPVILEIVRTPYADRSVRQFLLGELAPPPCRAVVTLDSSMETIFRTYQLVEAPSTPTEVFRTVEAAVEWIKAQTEPG